MYRLGGNRLEIGTHTREEETLGVLVMRPKVSSFYCRIIGFSPLEIDNYWPADECALTMREGIALLKRLNKDL